MGDSAVDTYLNDHLAGAMFGSDLAKQLSGRTEGTPRGAVMASLAAQIRQSLGDLIRDTHGETIVKLRAFVAGAGDARRVQTQAADLFTERKLPLPVLSVLQVGALGDEAAKVVIEAVVSTRKTVNSTTQMTTTTAKAKSNRAAARVRADGSRA